MLKNPFGGTEEHCWITPHTALALQVCLELAGSWAPCFTVYLCVFPGLVFLKHQKDFFLNLVPVFSSTSKLSQNKKKKKKEKQSKSSVWPFKLQDPVFGPGSCSHCPMPHPLSEVLAFLSVPLFSFSALKNHLSFQYCNLLMLELFCQF